MVTEDERDEYVPPTAIPAPTRRDTLELEARVKIAPTTDPRRAPTQPRLDVTDDRRPTLRKLKPGEPTPPGPPVVLDEPMPRASALMPVLDGRADIPRLGTEVVNDGPPPSSRGRWKTDRLPILQSPPPPAPASERPAPKPRDQNPWVVALAAFALVTLVLIVWTRLRRAEEPPAPASAPSIAPPVSIEPPAETPPAPSAEPPPPPLATTPPEPTAKASAKPRASVAPSARPSATPEAPPSAVPSTTSSAPPPPPSAAPAVKPEPPELVQ